MCRQEVTVLIGVMIFVLQGCTWVKATREGDRVQVLDASSVVHCRLLGQTNVSLLARVAGYNRDPRQVQLELDTLARNAAADMDGDTVVPIDKPREGKQAYDVYRCAEASFNQAQ